MKIRLERKFHCLFDCPSLKQGPKVQEPVYTRKLKTVSRIKYMVRFANAMAHMKGEGHKFTICMQVTRICAGCTRIDRKLFNGKSDFVLQFGARRAGRLCRFRSEGLGNVRTSFPHHLGQGKRFLLRGGSTLWLKRLQSYGLRGKSCVLEAMSRRLFPI